MAPTSSQVLLIKTVGLTYLSDSRKSEAKPKISNLTWDSRPNESDRYSREILVHYNGSEDIVRTWEGGKYQRLR